MVYEKFAKLLAERGVSAYAVAKGTGLYPGKFSDWKAGKYNPKIASLKKIAKFFDVPVEYFYDAA